MIVALRDWYTPRSRVFWLICAGYTTFAIAFALSFASAPRLAPIAAPLDRLLLAVQLCAGPAAVKMLVLQGLWRMGDTVEAETRVLDGLESRRWKVTQRVMTNTLEQTGIFVPMFLAVAVRMDPSHVWLLPVLMGLWCIGRLLFWAGYLVDPPFRAFGMDWTSSVAMITAGWLGWTLVA